MTNLFNYIDRPSPIHRLTGASKLVCLLAWSLAAMTSFYTPLLIALTAASIPTPLTFPPAPAGPIPPSVPCTAKATVW